MYPTLLHLRLEIGMVKLGHFENVLETLFFHEIFDQLKANIVFELLVCQKFEFSKTFKIVQELAFSPKYYHSVSFSMPKMSPFLRT